MTSIDERAGTEECPNCGSVRTFEEWRTEHFPYGIGDDATVLSAWVPLVRCKDCNLEFTDYRGEEARHAAVCCHLGVLTPSEIVAIREDIGLTRAEFAALGGFGVASLQRWESGTLIQNYANDRLIYLLQFRTTRQQLSKKVAQPGIDLDAAGWDGSGAKGISFRSLATSALATDDTTLRAAAVFSGLMTEGAMFQCPDDSLCLQ